MKTLAANPAAPEGAVLYERLILASFALSLLQGALQLAPSLTVNGWAISLTKLFMSPILSLLLGFAVTRLRSRIAAAVFILSLLASLWLVWLDLVESYWNNIPFAIGAGTVLIDLLAASIIIRWVAKSEL
ncbi:MAG TPA: hypothetical protein VLA50_05180 [Erythrobacter sp.]|nr:hypothetical protein [Erythrobacter sp.]